MRRFIPTNNFHANTHISNIREYNFKFFIFFQERPFGFLYRCSKKRKAREHGSGFSRHLKLWVVLLDTSHVKSVPAARLQIFHQIVTTHVAVAICEHQF